MTSSFESALGTIYITTSDEAVRAISFNPKQSFDSPLTRVHRAFRRQIKEYFEGKRKVFDLGLDLEGTPFQKEVWKITSRIPFGETRTYRDIAKQLGDVKKSRAVWHALGLNPILIVVPCHRVIGEDGKLHGYAGGKRRKQWLLNREYEILSGQTSLF